MSRSAIFPWGFLLSLLVFALAGVRDARAEEKPPTSREEMPDLRSEEFGLKIQSGDFLLVPIPVSEPTLGTGLVLGGGYFYPQSAAQRRVQPASLTAGAGFYTDNDSYAYGLAQMNFWGGDRWRFLGVAAHADLNLALLPPAGEGSAGVDWNVRGDFLLLQLARRVAGDWYLGARARYVDVKQTFGVFFPRLGFDVESHTVSSSLGLSLERDTRDLPFNPYRGSQFMGEAMFANEALGSHRDYRSYRLAWRAYHEVGESLVLAWELEACHRAGIVPLWDSCRVGLRGFPATDYLGKSSASGQLEARWRFAGRWGLVGFAGLGGIDNVASEAGDGSAIPSYGAGLRFMVLPAKRINMRLDYARSSESDAVYFAVGEAF